MLKLQKSSSGKAFPLPKTGSRMARLVRLIDLGVQKREYKGEIKTPVRQACFIFELPNDLMEMNDKQVPMLLWVNNVSLLAGQEKAKITSIVNALSPDKFIDDVGQLIGKTCMINIVLKDKKNGGKRAEASAFSPMPDIPGLVVPEQVVTSFVFETENPTTEAWKQVPDWMKEVIRQGVGVTGTALEAFLYQTDESSSGAPALDDDCPF